MLWVRREPCRRGESWMLGDNGERGTSASPASLGAALWLCRALLLAQLSSFRAPHPFLMATVQQSQGLGVLTMGPAHPRFRAATAVPTPCSSWSLEGLVKEGGLYSHECPPDTTKGPRLSRPHELTPQRDTRLGKAKGYFRGSYGDPRVSLTEGKEKRSLRTILC